MADITDISPFAVGEAIQYYVSYFGEPPRWYNVGATVVAINPPTNSSNETFDISLTFTVPANRVSTTGLSLSDNGVRPYRERPLQVGQICDYILRTDEEGNAISTMPYTIISKQNDGALVLSFTQLGMHADHLHKLTPDINPFVMLIMLVNQLSPICLICISVIVCTDNVISHDETGK